jgi:3-oxoacyl-[acyl-carrier protein] reductase
MAGRLQDKFAIVTGGGRGIGGAIVDAFADEGAHVAIAEMDEQTGAAKAAEVKAKGRQSLFVKTDVSKKTDIDAMIAKVIQTFGRIDILVCNAGIHLMDPFINTSEEMFDRIIATNLKSQYFTSQAAAKDMVQRGEGGKIIVVSSISSEVADPGASAYCVGKGGSQMLVRSAAQELAEHNIQVNAIAPGTIKTKLTEWYETQEAADYCAKLVPAQRYGYPKEIAGAAVYLASDESSYTTGATIVIDGGLMTQ